MITVSAGEFALTVSKACLGAGVERGVAFELGRGCMELALVGQQPIPGLVSRLTLESAQNTSCEWSESTSGWKAQSVVSLSSAVSMVDFASLSDLGARSPHVLVPEIVIGLALNRMRCTDCRFEISFNGGVWNSISELIQHTDFSAVPCSVALRLVRQREAEEPHQIVAVDLPLDDWKSLQPWVAKTLVPTSETNRADAGAGNTDND